MFARAAGAMSDPTQPPPQLVAPKAAGATGAASAASPAPTAPLRLQGLRAGDSALIDGRLRRVGERWQGYQLLRIEGHAAWLRDPEGRLLRLSLLPPTDRRP
jgi:hypothetical protein